MTQEALKMALDALETELSIDWANNDEFNASAEKMYKAIAAIKEALAQPEQEFMADDFFRVIADRNPKPFSSLQRTWVGLIDKDMNEPKTHILDFIAGARWAESILKGRNT